MPDLIRIRFTRPFNDPGGASYRRGELAGFDARKARNLVERLKVAVRCDPNPQHQPSGLEQMGPIKASTTKPGVMDKHDQVFGTRPTRKWEAVENLRRVGLIIDD